MNLSDLLSEIFVFINTLILHEGPLLEHREKTERA